jgi:hypothetical protein
VADQDEARADLGLHLAQGLHDMALRDDVERAGGFVGDDEVGAEADADGDADPLFHAPRQFVRVEPAHDLRVEPHARQRRVGPALKLLLPDGALMGDDAVPDLVLDRITGLSEFIAPCGM